jgi:hypothetical protein
MIELSISRFEVTEDSEGTIISAGILNPIVT